MKQTFTSLVSPAIFKAAQTNTLSALKTPFGIAVLASVGVHGLIFAFWPSFSQVSIASLGTAGAAEEERTVPLVQLSPTEQNRLPDFSASRFPANLLGNLSQPKLSSALPNPRQTPNRPPSSFFNRQLGQPGMALPQIASPPPRSASAYFGSSPSIPLLRIPPPPSTRPNLIGLSPRLTPSPSASASPPNPQQPTSIPAPQARTTMPATPANPASPETSMSAVVSPPAADSPAAIAAAAPSEAAQAQLDKLLSTLVFEPTGTTATEAAAAKASWLANAQTQAGEIGLITANPSSVTLDSNIRLCVENPPVNGLVGILVNPEGAIVSEPKLLKSTGYANLNQAALNAARRSSFEAADQFAAYEVTINVSYDAEACVEPEQALQTPAE